MLHPQNSALWQECLANAQARLDLPPQTWRVQFRAVRKYRKAGGKFEKITAQPTNRLMLANALSQRGIPVTASLMTTSLDHQWRQYLGHSIVAFDQFIADGSDTLRVPRELQLRPNDFFGWRVTGGNLGWELLLASAPERRVIIPANVGYTLMALSRELSRREIRFRDAHG